MSEPVDRVLVQLDPDVRAVAEHLRTLIREEASHLNETVKWGCPCYIGQSHVLHLQPHDDYIRLAFFHGANLSDPNGLLEGTGKGMRHIKVRSIDDIDQGAFCALIREAVQYDAE